MERLNQKRKHEKRYQKLFQIKRRNKLTPQLKV